MPASVAEDSGAAARRHNLFAKGFALIEATRADRWLRPLAQGDGVILMFHHVRPARERPFCPNQYLEVTPEFLDMTITVLKREGFDIISLDEVPRRLKSPRGNKPFAVITFDDGYRDNIEYAWPVLKRHKVPWTIFVVADFADGHGRLWWHEIEAAIARQDRISFSLDGSMEVMEVRTLDEKKAAFETLVQRLKAGPEDRLRAVAAELAAQINLDPNRLVRDYCATWDELRALAKDSDVTIGSHTVTHPILARHEDDFVRREMLQGKAAVEERLGIQVRHMAYPLGDRNSAGDREFRLSREAGFTTCLTTRPGHVFQKHAQNLTALPRVSINGLYQTEPALRALLSGVPFLPWEIGNLGLNWP
ncbi:polysaccharide deacetylase family protein [Microvirga flavescens]|uniref:polysaccharide deacetylase family protein n=1 Tax=Microvirga flavescens TaxID=2249811 RepID=UPI000DDA9F4C|nr:polysaccharide deacetylase family protein [Microvirga flavescens]